MFSADNRITSMETGTALVRAMIKVMQLSKEMPLHVINMSYGEHANFSCSGCVLWVLDLLIKFLYPYPLLYDSEAQLHLRF